MRQRHVIVVGGGASGLVAAITAAREGAKVTLIEQKDRVGKKILSTGNGRCNFTNEYMELQCFRGDDLKIVSTVLEQFGYQDTLDFFDELGVLFKNRQGYLYPISDQASTILEVLRMELERLSVQLVLNEKVTNVEKGKAGFVVSTQRTSYKSDALILATGGKAASALGSDGSGYALAKSFGHSISPVVPALVQLRCKGSFLKQLAGIRTHANVKLCVDNIAIASDTGELQLTNYGISGIPVFQVSRYAGKALYRRQSVTAVIDFLPNTDCNSLKRLFVDRKEKHPEKSAEDFLIGMFHKKLIPVLLKNAGIDLKENVSKVRTEQWETFVTVCKQFTVEVESTNDFEQAQVCAGGVRTAEVDENTMESKYAEDLYLTGELLDVDGICGGYNLQWAWATGYLAGEHAAKGR